MKLATIQTPHGPRAALATADGYIDLHATDPGLPTCVKTLLAASPAVRKAAGEVASSKTAVKYAANAVKLLPPIPHPSKVLCIGLNYRDHAIEGGKAIPTEPVLFGKFPNTLIAHGEPIVLPKVAEKVDYEAELVIVIGKRGQAHPEHGRGVRVRRRVHVRARRERPRLAVPRRGEAVDHRQDVRHVRADRPGAGDRRRTDQPAQTTGTTAAERDDAPELEHQGVHLRRAAPAVVPVAGVSRSNRAI